MVFRANVKNAIKKYSKNVGLSMSTGAIMANYGRIWGPIVENSFWIWENHVDEMEVWESVYWAYANFVSNILAKNNAKRFCQLKIEILTKN